SLHATSGALRTLPAVPTRRSSDLLGNMKAGGIAHAVDELEGLGLFVLHAHRLQQCTHGGSRGMSGGQVQATVAAHLTLQWGGGRSEEHTSELQSRENLVCRLLLEK